MALEYAEEFERDWEILTAAVKKDLMAFKFAAQELKNDKQFIQELLTRKAMHRSDLYLFDISASSLGV